MHERVLLEPFRPIQEISVVGASIASHLRVRLTMRFRMVSDVDRYRGSRFILDPCPKSGLCANGYAVFLAGPCFALLMMSYLAPSGELPQGVIVAPAEYLGAEHPSVVVRPSCYDGIEFADDRFLRSVSQFPQCAPDFPRVSFSGLLAGRMCVL